MTRQGLIAREYLRCMPACMQTLRHLLFPLPNPESHLSGDWQAGLPLSRVPCSLFLSRLVLVWCWNPACLAFPVLVKTLSKEEMSRSNLNPPTVVTITRLCPSIHLSARTARRGLPTRPHPRFQLPSLLLTHTSREFFSTAIIGRPNRWRCRTLVCLCLFFRRPSPVVGLP
jgi:hypothetical protein